jgi:hypothetical protein
MRELGLNQAGVAAAGGPSPATLRQLFSAADAGKPFKDLQMDTQAKFDRSLQWEPGSTRDTLAGGKPRPLGAVGVLRGRDQTMGTYEIVLPQDVLEQLADLSPLERVEAEADLVAHFLGKIRQLRSDRVLD